MKKIKPAAFLSLTEGPLKTAANQYLLPDVPVEELGMLSQRLLASAHFHSSLGVLYNLLCGIVMIDAKSRLPHGSFVKWTRATLGKSRSRANSCARVARLFLDQYPRASFAQLSLALSDERAPKDSLSLNMEHPIVSAASKWVAGRTFDELEKGASRPARGGDNHPRCPECGEIIRKYENPCRHCHADTGNSGVTPGPRTESDYRADAQKVFRGFAETLMLKQELSAQLHWLPLEPTTDAPLSILALQKLHEEFGEAIAAAVATLKSTRHRELTRAQRLAARPKNPALAAASPAE